MKGTDEQIYAMSDKERNNRKAGVLIQCILEELKTKYSQLYRAFSVFDVVPTDDDIVLATDGRNIYFHAMNLSTKLGEYGSKGYKYIEHTLLHICLHCVLGHLWESQAYSNKSAIGAILDRQAEEIVLMLCNEKQEWDRCDSYFDLTRDKKRLLEYAPFYFDDHCYWEKVTGNQKDPKDTAQPNSVLAGWEEIGKEFRDNGQVHEVETMCDYRDSKSDYSELLKRLLCREVTFGEHKDSIDYMMYSYSGELYEDALLVDDCEEEFERDSAYKLYIAIDTSGSCSGEIVKSFLSETEKILCDLSLYTEDISTTLIQCDERIRQIDEINHKNIRHGMFKNIVLKGFCGTNFSPVFDYVREHKETDKAPVLIYLTDGMGRFPDIIPTYPVYFILPSYNADASMKLPEYVKTITF